MTTATTPDVTRTQARDAVRRDLEHAIDSLIGHVTDAALAHAQGGNRARDTHARQAWSAVRHARADLLEWADAYADVAVSTDDSVKRTPWSLSDLIPTPALAALSATA